MKILNIAHRGYSGKFEENTMIAFEKAIEYKADGIETDVQLSKDKIPVLIHDETLERTTDGKGYVKDYTLAELKRFRTKSGEEIPTLKEFFELVADSNLKILNLELKNSIFPYDGLEEKVLEMIYEYDIQERIIISTFNHLSLVKVRELDKEIKLGALTSSTLANVPKYLKDISVECYHPCFPSILNEEYVKEIQEAGIEINPYTVNEEEHMKMVIKFNTDSIITNEVERLHNLLNCYENKQ
ncbi:glycerophosphoryl diester phosphodiesterase [Clostridium sp. DL-VIII]|uniref:glycerophosphodiester phosphodiesterase n=1 Tax=Clostridium sp. DL-VIII TaxID=641107 RepID=UPI00023B0388|nr:glycerophosphodiester phosphodiesterase [Clostridium sp. DL-VIII]EHJ01295.1 glycerophosphoryl diester phosphodiesterase [Clostridium sp. DL-VIII]